MSPRRGSTAGGTRLTVSGSGLDLLGVDAAVSIGGVLCDDVVVAAGGAELSCTTGAPPAGNTTRPAPSGGGMAAGGHAHHGAAPVSTHNEGHAHHGGGGGGDDNVHAAPLGPHVVSVVGETGAARHVPPAAMYEYADLWSRDSTWGGCAGCAPVEGDSVYIPAGNVVIMVRRCRLTSHHV